MVEFVEVLFLGAGVSMLAVAGWVLRQAPRARLNRAFAVFFAVAAGHALTEATNVGVRWAPLFDYAYPFAATVFVLAFRERYGGRQFARAVPWVLFAAVLGLWTLQWRAPSTFSDPDGIFDQGPLFFMAASVVATNAAVAIVLARDALAASSRTARSASLVLSAGFVCQGLVYAPLLAIGLAEPGGLIADGDPLSGRLRALAELAAIVATAVLVVVVASRTLRSSEPDVRRLGVVYLVAAGLSATVLVAVSPFIHREDPFAEFLVTIGTAEAIVLFLLPVVAAYATLRGRLFDGERPARRAVQASTIAALLVALSFIISEVVAEFVGARWGPYVGISLAGLALLAYAPLQHVAARVAEAAVPPARPLAELDKAERLELLREQVAFAWADGMLTRNERLRLEGLRARLGLTAEDVSAIEVELAGASPA